MIAGLLPWLKQQRQYVVMRYPVIMEDEGRHSYIQRFKTLEEAKKWIANQEQEYFKPSDYYIAK